jgi:hypothetical protein
MGLIATVILAVIGAIVAVCISAAGRLVADEFIAWRPRLTDWIVKVAVKRLPERHRERLEEEWLSHISDAPGGLGKIIIALDCLRAAHKLTRADVPFNEQNRLGQVEILNILSSAVPGAAIAFVLWMTIPALPRWIAMAGGVLYFLTMLMMNAAASESVVSRRVIRLDIMNRTKKAATGSTSFGLWILVTCHLAMALLTAAFVIPLVTMVILHDSISQSIHERYEIVNAGVRAQVTNELWHLRTENAAAVAHARASLATVSNRLFLARGNPERPQLKNMPDSGSDIPGWQQSIGRVPGVDSDVTSNATIPDGFLSNNIASSVVRNLEDQQADLIAEIERLTTVQEHTDWDTVLETRFKADLRFAREDLSLPARLKALNDLIWSSWFHLTWYFALMGILALIQSSPVAFCIACPLSPSSNVRLIEQLRDAPHNDDDPENGDD